MKKDERENHWFQKQIISILFGKGCNSGKRQFQPNNVEYQLETVKLTISAATIRIFIYKTAEGLMKYDEHKIVDLSNKSREFISEKAVAMENADFSTISCKYQLKTKRYDFSSKSQEYHYIQQQYG